MKIQTYINPKKVVCCALLISLLFASCENLTITTVSSTAVTASTATINGEVKDISRTEIYNKGVCYSTTPNPKVDYKLKNYQIENNERNDFTFVLTRLLANTTYYVRAYADYSTESDPSIRTKYGNEISFITTNATVASISTTIELPNNYGGEILDDGGTPILERGICYKTSSSPTILDNKLIADTMKMNGSFNLNPWLKPGPIYYLRAYATNSSGTAYGNEIVIGVPNFVCAGNSWDIAALYDPTKKGIHPIISDFTNSYPKGWAPSALNFVELLVCKKQKSIFYKTCYYTDGTQIKRYYAEEIYTLREVKTGKIIAKKIFRGAEEDCDGNISYRSGEYVSGIRSKTTYADNMEIVRWIRSFVLK